MIVGRILKKRKSVILKIFSQFFFLVATWCHAHLIVPEDCPLVEKVQTFQNLLLQAGQLLLLQEGLHHKLIEIEIDQQSTLFLLLPDDQHLHRVESGMILLIEENL